MNEFLDLAKHTIAFNEQDGEPIVNALVPRTNLSEAKHASWLAGEGYKNKISLYDACVSDLINAYFQCARQMAFMEGKYIGGGPDLEILIERALSRQTSSPSPAATSRAIDDAVMGTPMFTNRISFKGEKKTIRAKRPLHEVHEGNVGSSSHRPEFVYVTVDKHEQEPQGSIKPEEGEAALESLEQDIHATKWALRRIPIISKVQCNHWAGGKKCNVVQRGGEVAPCFWSDCQLSSWRKEKYCYFCNTDVRHTWKITKIILHPPTSIPDVWPIGKGTHMKVKEARDLIKAGFEIGIPLQNILQRDSEEDKQKNIQEDKQKYPYRRGISKAAYAQINAALDMNVEIVGGHVQKEGNKEVFNLRESSSKEALPIEVTIQNHPLCSCAEFNDRLAKRRPYLACKHIYFVFLMVLGQDVNNSMHIHQSKIPNYILKEMLTKSSRSHPQQL